MAVAQEPLNCDLCSNEDVKFRCMNCKELLCIQCKKTHLKSKASRDHKVLSLAEVTSDEQEKKEQEVKEANLFCDVHTKEAYQRYCQTCNRLVCIECIVSVHKEHDFATISESVGSIRNELQQTILIWKETKVPALKKIIGELRDENMKYDADMINLISEIKRRGKDLIKDIEEIQEQFITEMEQLKQNNLHLMETFYCKCNTELADLEKIIQKVEDGVRSNKTGELLKLYDNIKVQISEHNKPIQKQHLKPIPELVVQNTNSEKRLLKQLYGSIIQRNENVILNEAIVVRKVMCSMGESYHICPVEDGSKVWNYTPKHFEILYPNCGRSHRLPLDFYANDSALISPNDLLFSVDGKQKILKISDYGSIITFKSTSPYRPFGLRVTDSNILVCLRGQSGSGGKVERLSLTGKLLNTYQHDPSDNTLLFSSPFHLTENINGDIWVSQQMGGQVVVINREGKRKFIYTRIHMPGNIDHNKYGHVTIIDFVKKQIHLVDVNGDFIQLISVKDTASFRPQALAHDEHSRLWIGCENNTMFAVKYVS